MSWLGGIVASGDEYPHLLLAARLSDKLGLNPILVNDMQVVV
jgi:hypothetical protein